MRTGWFEGPLPRILAHRGLAIDAPENSLAAFRAALVAGATHLETDVRATSDGIAVLVHDARTADGPEVHALSLAALRALLPELCTLDEALAALPGARFNIDVKDARAARPVARTVLRRRAADRVLITSFRRGRRRAVVRRLPPVATSAARGELAVALAAMRARLPRAARAALDRVDAVQLPVRRGRIDLASQARIAAFHGAGVEVHYWVINDPEGMRELVRRGADGIVTDRPDLAAAALR